MRRSVRVNPLYLFCVAAAGALGAAILAFPAHGQTQAAQDANQSAPNASAPAYTPPAAPKPVNMPDGEGKPLAVEYCQDCHRLTNLTSAHKAEDEWKDTVQTMIDRGARIPDDKVDTLVKYLSKNFGPAAASPSASTPKPAAPSADSPSAPPATAGANASPNAVSAPAAATVKLPPGDGKAIAEENCQLCHKLNMITKAHKSLDEWKDTIQTMIDRGATIPTDKVDALAEYLAKNFGPSAAPAAGSAAPAAPAN